MRRMWDKNETQKQTNFRNLNNNKNTCFSKSNSIMPEKKLNIFKENICSLKWLRLINSIHLVRAVPEILVDSATDPRSKELQSWMLIW